MNLHELPKPKPPILPGVNATMPDIRYEIWGVVDVSEDLDETEYEQVDPSDDIIPDIWSIYLHDQHCLCLEDFMTREEALTYAAQYNDYPIYDLTREGNP